MSNAYAIGHITVKNTEKWAEYCRLVPATLAPWNAELILRGKHAEILHGQHSYSDVVVIHFPSKEAINHWYASPAYQALIPLRQQAADIVLLSYEV